MPGLEWAGEEVRADLTPAARRRREREDQDLAHAAVDVAGVERLGKQIIEGRIGSLRMRPLTRSAALVYLRRA